MDQLEAPSSLTGPLVPMLQQWATIFAQTQQSVAQIKREGMQQIKQQIRAATLQKRLNKDQQQKLAASQRQDLQLALNQHLVQQSIAYRQSFELALQQGAQMQQELIEYEDELESSRESESHHQQAIASAQRKSPMPGWTSESLHAQLLLHQDYLSLFYLFESLFISTNDNVTTQLIDWLHRTCAIPPLFADSAAALNEDEDTPAVDSESWWFELCTLCAHGRIALAVSFLTDESTPATAAAESTDSIAAALRRTHDSDHLHRLVQLLESLPTLNPQQQDEEMDQDLMSDNANLDSQQQRLVSRLQSWRAEVKQLHSSASGSGDAALAALCLLLTGDMSSLVDASATFYELVVAQLIYLAPHSTRDDLPRLVQQSHELMQQKHAFYARQDQQNGDASPNTDFPLQLSARDECLRLVLSLQIDTALIRCEQMEPSSDASCGSHWWLSHAIDLLSHARAIDAVEVIVHHHTEPEASSSHQQQQQQSLDRREYSLSQYMNALLRHESLWRLLPIYCQACPLIGSEYLRRLVLQGAEDQDSAQLISEQPESGDQLAPTPQPSDDDVSERITALLELCDAQQMHREHRELCLTRGTQLARRAMAQSSIRFGEAIQFLCRSGDLVGEARCAALIHCVVRRILVQPNTDAAVNPDQACAALAQIVQLTSQHEFKSPIVQRLADFSSSLLTAWRHLALTQSAASLVESLLQSTSAHSFELKEANAELHSCRQQCVQTLVLTLSTDSRGLRICPREYTCAVMQQVIQLLPSDADSTLGRTSFSDASSVATQSVFDSYLSASQASTLLHQLQAHRMTECKTLSAIKAPNEDEFASLRQTSLATMTRRLLEWQCRQSIHKNT